ncbi:MAG: Helicase associated domain protein [Gallionella sp.]|nr:Helicase associated domain protein [Gallionella sp.]
MTSKHSSAHRLLSTGLFDSLNSFSDLEARISALSGNKERGDAFEIFAEAYLATQKITLAQEVWPFEAIPLEQRQALSLDTGRDMGVDGTYLTIDGELRAYQVKFRSNRPSLTWDELSTFMGLTDQVSQRVLFTNCETLPSLMQDRSGFIPIRGSDFDRLAAEDFEAMRQWLCSGQVKLPRKQSRPHQQEALTAIARGLVENDRATVVMACGTGKSLVALWAAEQHGCKNLLVLVPSLALVRQLLHEWLKETAWEQLTFMCVCSDPTVTKGADDLIVHQADLDFPVTTESAAVSRFLSKPFDGVRIVFSTYQSAQVVADGMPVGADGMAQPFDLAVFDEAHKTASKEGTRFSFALADANLPIRKRLFFTATPRHYDIRKKDKEGDNTLVYSMDKPEIYGPVVHALSFAEAARRGIICDYKVVISVVTSAMVNDHLLQHGKVIVDGDTVKARQVALQIALQKAVEKYGVSRIFTFHGSVAAARSFTSGDGEGIRNHLPDFTTLHVSGEMRTSLREDHMKFFRQAKKAVMSNARCLTEGVDVPAVDMVAFISPRKSKVDIVQATGRAMRKSPSKEFGYVMVPLFVEQAANESIEEALQRTGFDDIWDLLGAMREQDDVLTDIIRQMREDKGRSGGYDESRFNERVEVLGPSVSLDMIRESITAECLEPLGASWDEWFGELLAFAEREGHCLIPNYYCTSAGDRLGRWVGVQRGAQNDMSSVRKERLEAAPGWVWDVSADQWETGFRYLSEFAKCEGHCRVPYLYQTIDGYRLGQWIGEQRKDKNNLLSVRKERLEALLGWMWDVQDEKWEVGFRHLKKFSDREGDCRINGNFQTSDGYKLGIWVTNQRATKDALAAERKERLEALAGWVWDVRADQWEIGFRHLKEFVERERSSLLPVNYRTNDGYRLGVWVSTQRKAKDGLSAERKERLEAVSGWVWDVSADQWEIGFRHCTEFVEREGGSLLPVNYRTNDGYRLGVWVSTQRAAKDSLPADKKKRLEAVSGWVWNVFTEQWEMGFRHLTEFADREGHCRVLHNYQMSDGYRLGQWVLAQRSARESLSIDQKGRLEALPGWVWDAVDERWEEGFRNLQTYSVSMGHANVPKTWASETGYRLGEWVTGQRKRQESIPIERKLRLEALKGWVWYAVDERWEEGFRNLQTYVASMGHANVPGLYKMPNGYRLGGWVSEQRKRQETITSERKIRLEALVGWAWDGISERWSTGFSLLQEYVAQYGNSKVVGTYRTESGFRLGGWVSEQRKWREKLSPERKLLLETVSGWTWDVHEEQWEEGLNYLTQFVEQYGHSRVPQNFQTSNGYRLGQWVSERRKKKDRLSSERRAQLEALPEWAWRIKG